MASPDFQRSKEVFQTALSRAPESREAFLDEACGGDGELRREVDQLLAAHDRARGFLSSPAGLHTPHDEERSEHTAGPQRIGPYAIVDTIAHGGMGIVYRAVRDDDAFRKTVALKVVGGGRHSEYFAQRFRQERQILASLQHPSIAAVLDGGTSEDGRPYLVMEYVEGQPITEYCARRALGARERAALFRTVCGAVHYAHQNLVVHRDIKPANVLVDAHGVPKLLDFGIAKLLASGVDPDVAPTATVLPMMTPEYASPEQVKGETVTTASDVYSLGVLFYELLAGRRPYEVNTDSLAAIVRTVCETEPKAPSEVAGAETVKTLRGDLDTIVLKALRKEPGRRYPSAHELSEDVRRCLEGLPVTARPDTLRYRAGKFVQRHRTGVAAAAIVVLVLLGGLAATIRQRRIAERRFDQVRSLATFVMFDMHDAIAGLPGATPARKQLVERALQYLDGLAAEAAADAALRAEIAKGYERLGKIQGGAGTANLGDRAGARASLQKAIAIRERLAATGGDTAAVTALAVAWGDLVRVHFSEEKRDEAGAALARMNALLRSLPADSAGDPRVLYAWQHCHDLEAMKAGAAGDGAGLRDARARQLQVAKVLLEKDPADLVRQRNVALAHKYLGGAMHGLDELGPARAHYEEARRLDRLGVEAEPMNANRKLDLSFSHAGVASVLRDEGDLDGARAAYDEALRLRQEVFASDPANEFAFKALVRAHRSLAEVSAREGDADGALSHSRVVLTLHREWESTHPSRHGNPEWDARHQWDLGDLRVLMAGRPRLPPSAQRAHWLAARSHYAQALATWQALGAATPLDGEYAAHPERLAKEVAKCDAALLRLGG